MRYIGNKERLVQHIYEAMKIAGVEGNTFFDMYTGTTSVAKFFKKKGYRIYSNDLLYFSYVLQRAYILNNKEPTFEKLFLKLDIKKKDLLSTPLQDVLNYLDQLPEIKGFIYNNYTPEGTAELEVPRMYYTGKNGKFIDKVRYQIGTWKDKELINSSEYYILCACLIETISFFANTSGVYAAFNKKWDPRAVKEIKLREIEICSSNLEHNVYNSDSISLIKEITADIYYLDPPYNQRQYAPNYHLLETIAKNDAPVIRGISGMRDYTNKKSRYCNRVTALEELQYIAEKGNYNYLVLSYSSDGIMKTEEILSVLKSFGSVELVEIDYRRYKSNKSSKIAGNFVKEQLFILKRS